MKLIAVLVTCLLAVQSSVQKRVSDRERDGFTGPAKRVSETVTRTDPDPGNSSKKICTQMTYVYDRDGRLAQRLYKECGSDQENRLTFIYAPGGSRSTKSEDIDGNQIRPTPKSFNLGYDDNGPLRDVFKYDADGRLTEMSSLRSKGSLINKTTYKYDSKGRLAETDYLGPDGAISERDSNIYDGDSNLLESVYRWSISTISVTKYSDYEFNPRGDWIKRREVTESQSSRPKFIYVSQREIEYYQ